MKSCWTLKLSSVLLSFFCFTSGLLHGQFSLHVDSTVAPNTSEKSYLFPINPGTPAVLTGTMGELRSTHFHAGLDIDTPSTGVPVTCVADGYMLQATAGTSGYGNVLYVQHKDGNVSVYAHLEEFKGPVGQYIREQRYAQKTSEINLSFQPDQFPVKKGDVIALSGNTGSSGGPHLHFEIRNADNEAINPMMYQFNEIKDGMAPRVEKIAIRTLSHEARVNDQFGRFEFSVLRQQNNYLLSKPLLANGLLGIEVLAHDKMENSRFRYGINYIEMLVDDEKVFSQTIDKIDFGESRGILTLLDYKTMMMRGTRFNKLYVDDGNRLKYYKGTNEKSFIHVTDKVLKVTVLLRDYHGNTSTVNFTLKPSPSVSTSPLLGAVKKPYEVDLYQNTLKVTVKPCTSAADEPITIYQGDKAMSLNRAYGSQLQHVFLVDLKKHLPDSIQTCQGTIGLHYKDRVPSGTDYRFYSNRMEVNFPNRALYDTLYLAAAYDSANNIFTLGSRFVPLHTPVDVSLQPNDTSTPGADLGVYRKEGNNYYFVKSNWQDGWFRFTTRELGEYTFRRDTIPPTITKLSVTTSSARFRIRDNLSGIARFEANVNGEWLLMVYDYKTGIIRSERLDTTKQLRGDFVFKVIDNAGNERIYNQTI
jgi:hypothetical protein